MESRLDESIEATQRECSSDSAVDSKVVLGVSVEIIAVNLGGVDAAATDQVGHDTRAGEGVHEIRVRSHDAR